MPGFCTGTNDPRLTHQFEQGWLEYTAMAGTGGGPCFDLSLLPLQVIFQICFMDIMGSSTSHNHLCLGNGPNKINQVPVL